MSRMRTVVIAVVVLLGGCAAPTPPATNEPRPSAGNVPVARVPLGPAKVTPPATALQAPAQRLPFPVPPATLNVCLKGHGDQIKQTAIEFAPNVGAICKLHPEMGPCQYERDLCRSGGGRVFAADGVEITRQVEDEYDRKVMRVRFRAN